MGRVVLIGAGPGAEDLITVRGLKLLMQADCVFYDALVSPSLLLHAKPGAQLVPWANAVASVQPPKPLINQQLIKAAEQHALVVRLKGGDPSVFGRADEEITAVQAAGHRIEMVPGVTAALAAASSLHTSLTLRGVARSLTFMTPAVGENEAPPIETLTGANPDTLAVYMGLHQTGAWAEQLLAKGRDAQTPVIVCESVSLPDEKFTALTLDKLPLFSKSSSGNGPCLILIGQALQNIGIQLQANQTVGILGG